MQRRRHILIADNFAFLSTFPKVLKVHKSALMDNQITKEKNYSENNVGITWFSLARIPQMPQTTIT